MSRVSNIITCLLLLLACSSLQAESVEQCDSLQTYFDTFSVADSTEEILPISIGDSTEGGEVKVYKDTLGSIVFITLTHFGETGKKEVSYTVIDEDNHRIEVSMTRYGKPIKVNENISIRERYNKRVDICEGTVVDALADQPNSHNVTFLPLHTVLEEIADFL